VRVGLGIAWLTDTRVLPETDVYHQGNSLCYKHQFDTVEGYFGICPACATSRSELALRQCDSEIRKAFKRRQVMNQMK
jgi:hypothetical protein